MVTLRNSTNPGTGYTSTNPPELVFDDPHSYDSIPVQYSSSGYRSGLQSLVKVSVGIQIWWILVKLIWFQSVDLLESLMETFEEFQITVDRIFTDNFNGWSVTTPSS